MRCDQLLQPLLLGPLPSDGPQPRITATISHFSPNWLIVGIIYYSHRNELGQPSDPARHHLLQLPLPPGSFPTFQESHLSQGLCMCSALCLSASPHQTLGYLLIQINRRISDSSQVSYLHFIINIP